MSEKRRDNKGRVLRDGESQREDGRYVYRYTDAAGNRRSVYSYRLVKTDKVPDGKRATEPLRDMIEKISQDRRDGIDSHQAEVPLNQFFDGYMAMKYELKESTRVNYLYMYGKFIRNGLGLKAIGSFRFSDIKKYYVSMMCEGGFKPNSIENLQTILHPVFQMAVRDGIIRVNPTDGVLNEIKKSHQWEKTKRHALTIPQQTRFVTFVRDSPVYAHWFSLFTVLLGTGGRIGEILGLCWSDCDFEQNVIMIRRNLIYRVSPDGKARFHVTTPKTKSGTRMIPMFADVKKALLTEQETQKEIGGNKSTIDGHSDFVFQNRFHEVFSPHVVNRAIVRISRDANLDTSAVQLPHFSAHYLRHTFCTRLCENETNLKVIQEIMGHRSIETTMDVYNEATKEKKMETFAALEGKVFISV